VHRVRVCRRAPVLLRECVRVRYDDEQDDNGNDDDDDDKVAGGIRLGTQRVAASQQRSQVTATLVGAGYRIRFALDSFVLDVFVLVPPSLSGHSVLSLGHFSSTLDTVMHA